MVDVKPSLGKVLVAVAVAVAAAPVVGLWALHAQWAGKHIRECGFDSSGLPYAVVRDNTIGGAKRDGLVVQFNYDNRWHEARQSAGNRVSLPTFLGHAIGGVTTVVHGTWPTREPDRPRKLYCILGGTGNNDYN